jgi:hypothetical protein
MAAPLSSKEVSPMAAAVVIGVLLLILIGIGWYWLARPSADSTRGGPARAPGLPAGIPPPPIAGPVAKPDTTR